MLRTLFATSTFMSDELVGYLIAAVGFLPLGYAFARGSILRVNLLLSWADKRPQFRTVVELCCVVGTLAVVGLLVWYFGQCLPRVQPRLHERHDVGHSTMDPDRRHARGAGDSGSRSSSTALASWWESSRSSPKSRTRRASPEASAKE